MLFVGVAFFAWAVTLQRNQSELLDDPRKVQGTIEETDLVKRSGTNGPTYRPKVQYSYEYEGEPYESEGITPGKSNYGVRRSKAEAALDELGVQEGDPTTVLVPPDSPGDGFLKAEKTTKSNLSFALVGLWLIVLGSLALASSFGLLS